MKSYKSLLFLALVPVLTLTSCYHEFPTGSGGSGGGGDGTASANVVITATPSSTFSFPALYWIIGQISIVTSAGAPVTIKGNNGVAALDFNRVQADSFYLGHVLVPATSFTSLQVQMNAPTLSGYLYNTTNNTIFNGTCAPATVCLLPTTVPGYGAATITVPITYAVSSGANTGFRVNFDLSKAVTTAGPDGITFDFTQAGAITLIPLPTTNNETGGGGIDTMDNFTGVVSAVTSSTVSVVSYNSEQRIFSIASTAEFDDPFGVATNCATQPINAACLAVGQNVSIDGIVNASDASGQFTANELEFLDPAPAVTELEGVITKPLANNQFTMVLTNGMGPVGFLVSTPITVTLNGAETYAVDPKQLGPSVTTSMPGFQSQTDLVLGQTVMVQGGTLNGTNGSVNSPTRVLLRYSTIGGALQNPSGTIFTLSAPSFVGPFNGSLQVQTYTNTFYDNISSFSGLSGLSNASVRGLFLNPNSGVTQALLAAKVRTH